MSIEGDTVRVRFKNAAGGLVSHESNADRLRDRGRGQEVRLGRREDRGGEVVLKSPAVAKPVAVRYGWANNPEANLYNKAGLPACPFRTDDWPGVTAGRK